MKVYIGKVGFTGAYYSKITKKYMYWVEGPDGDGTQVRQETVESAMVDLFNKWM